MNPSLAEKAVVGPVGARPGRRRDLRRSGLMSFIASVLFLVILVLPERAEAYTERPDRPARSSRRSRSARAARARASSAGSSRPPQRLEFMGFPMQELALLPTGPPETALERLANVFAYTPARFVATQNGKEPQDPGYHRFKAMPVGDDLKALLLESVRLDLTRQAEIIAADLCAFPKPGPHESREGQQPIYQYFAGDPESAEYIRGLLAQYRPDIQERAEILCRSWTTNGFVPPAWVLKPDGPGSLPQRFRQYLPEEVLSRLDGLGSSDAASRAGPPAPVEFVQLSTPANTLHAPPYKPDSAWGHWGFNPAIFEFFFSDPIIDDKPPVSLGRRGWVASPWA